MTSLKLFILVGLAFLQIAWMWQENPRLKEAMLKGQQAYNSKNLSVALGYYQDAVAIKPNYYDAIHKLGVIYEELKSPDIAEEKYLAVLKLNSRHLPTYYNLGLLYINQGDYKKGLFYLNKRIHYGKPNDPWTIKSKNLITKVMAQQEIERRVIVGEALDKVVAANNP